MLKKLKEAVLFFIFIFIFFWWLKPSKKMAVPLRWICQFKWIKSLHCSFTEYTSLVLKSTAQVTFFLYSTFKKFFLSCKTNWQKGTTPQKFPFWSWRKQYAKLRTWHCRKVIEDVSWDIFTSSSKIPLVGTKTLISVSTLRLPFNFNSFP